MHGAISGQPLSEGRFERFRFLTASKNSLQDHGARPKNKFSFKTACLITSSMLNEKRLCPGNPTSVWHSRLHNTINRLWVGFSLTINPDSVKSWLFTPRKYGIFV